MGFLVTISTYHACFSSEFTCVEWLTTMLSFAARDLGGVRGSAQAPEEQATSSLSSVSRVAPVGLG